MGKLLVVLTAALAAAPAAGAEPGFELHASLGPGYVTSVGSMNGFSQSVGGLGAAHSLMLGWAGRSGWVVGAEYWGTFVYSPRVQTRGPADADRLTYKTWGFGPCLRYQVASGLFASLTPSVTRVSLSDNDENGFTWKWGFGLRLAAGKEWRLSRRWSLGAALVAHLGTNAQDEAATPRWTTTGGGVVLAAGFR